MEAEFDSSEAELVSSQVEFVSSQVVFVSSEEKSFSAIDESQSVEFLFPSGQKQISSHLVCHRVSSVFFFQCHGWSMIVIFRWRQSLFSPLEPKGWVIDILTEIHQIFYNKECCSNCHTRLVRKKGHPPPLQPTFFNQFAPNLARILLR